MKKKVLIPIIVIAAAVVICVCAMKPRQPEMTLLDKAMELDDGQLICADGTLWQRDEEAQAFDIVVKIGRIKGELPESYVKGEIPINMLPHEFAVYSTEESAVFLDNTGKVWRLKRENWERCVIEPFYIEEELPETTVDGVKAKRWEANKIVLEVEKPDTKLQPFYVVGVHLADGWHYISKGSMDAIMYSGNKREYEAVFELPLHVKGEFRVDAYVPRNGEYYHGDTVWIELSR